MLAQHVTYFVGILNSKNIQKKKKKYKKYKLGLFAVKIKILNNTIVLLSYRSIDRFAIDC